MTFLTQLVWPRKKNRQKPAQAVLATMGNRHGRQDSSFSHELPPPPQPPPQVKGTHELGDVIHVIHYVRAGNGVRIRVQPTVCWAGPEDVGALRWRAELDDASLVLHGRLPVMSWLGISYDNNTPMPPRRMQVTIYGGDDVIAHGDAAALWVPGDPADGCAGQGRGQVGLLDS
jgi:hypothetical protein